MAKLAEQAERYEEMVEHMKAVAEMCGGDGLGLEERNLLSVAYKNVVGARRASLRIIKSILDKEQSKDGGSDKAGLIKGYQAKVEEELATICSAILNLIDTQLLPKVVRSHPRSQRALRAGAARGAHRRASAARRPAARRARKSRRSSTTRCAPTVRPATGTAARP